MKTKALLTLALSSAGMAIALGQTVSQNIVGYINVPVPAGLSMIANQLDNKNGNKVGDLLPDVTDGTTLFKWSGTGFVPNGFFKPDWDDKAMTLNPGEGVFISNPGAATKVTFVGEVKLGATSTPVPAGLSIISSQVPTPVKVGDLTDTGALTFPSGDGDTIFRWAGTGFTPNGYFKPDWDDATMLIGVGESVFYSNVGAAKTWTRTFTVQ